MKPGRVFEVIDAECVACNLCVDVCPVENCITMERLPAGRSTSGRAASCRTTYANWTTHPNNPLLAQVVVLRCGLLPLRVVGLGTGGQGGRAHRGFPRAVERRGLERGRRPRGRVRVRRVERFAPPIFRQPGGRGERARGIHAFPRLRPQSGRGRFAAAWLGALLHPGKGERDR
jgi:ferredoxin